MVSDEVFKTLRLSNKIDTIISDIHAVWRLEHDRGELTYFHRFYFKENKSIFRTNMRTELKKNTILQKQLMDDWYEEKRSQIYDHDANASYLNPSWVEVLLFHIIGKNNDYSEDYYPTDAEVCDCLDDKVAPEKIIKTYKNNYYLMALGIEAAGDLAEVYKSYYHRFKFDFNYAFSTYNRDATVSELVTLHGRLKKFIEEEPTKYIDEIVRTLEPLRRFAEVTGIPVPNNLLSEDIDKCLVSLNKDAENFHNNLQELLVSRPKAIPLDVKSLKAIFANNIVPPLRSGDLATVNAELDKAEKDRIRLTDTCLVKIILPILQGEKTLTAEDENLLEDYSTNFLGSLKNAARSLSAPYGLADPPKGQHLPKAPGKPKEKTPGTSVDKVAAGKGESSGTVAPKPALAPEGGGGAKAATAPKTAPAAKADQTAKAEPAAKTDQTPKGETVAKTATAPKADQTPKAGQTPKADQTPKVEPVAKTATAPKPALTPEGSGGPKAETVAKTATAPKAAQAPKGDQTPKTVAPGIGQDSKTASASKPDKPSKPAKAAKPGKPPKADASPKADTAPKTGANPKAGTPPKAGANPTPLPKKEQRSLNDISSDIRSHLKRLFTD
jgi:hypothetical protein